jgi:cytohesin
MYDAIWQRDADRLKTLLDANPLLVYSTNPGPHGTFGLTPLQQVVMFGGNINEAALLLAHGADVDAVAADKMAPLQIACNDAAMTEWLLAHGANVNAGTTGGWTPLHQAMMSGNKSVAELLIAHGANVSARTNDGETPLFLAARNQYKDLVELLLAHGADINARAGGDNTALSEAKLVTGGMAEFLQQHGGHDFFAEIFDASTHGDLAAVKELLKEDSHSAFLTDNERNTPLHYAAGGGHLEVVKLLLADGADVAAKDYGGAMPLHYAAYGGHMDVAELLLANKADINAKDLNGQTPVDCALFRFHGDMAEALRKLGGVSRR